MNWILAAIGVGIIWVIMHIMKTRRWKANVLTLDEYLAANPGAQTASGPACNKCGSIHITSHGVDGPDDYRRVTLCDACRTPLFRTEA